MSETPAGPAAAPWLRRDEVRGLGGALCLFAVLAVLRARGQPYPYFDDVSYLDAANRVREMGGGLELLGALFRGTWTEDNRNPLYLMLLAPFAGRDPGFHLRAQIVSIAIGAGAIWASWLCALRIYGPRAAMWTAFLLACSETMIAWSSREACEPLLLLLCALTFERLLRVSPTHGAFFAAGFLSGLAQLTKGNGLFVAVAAVLAIGWQFRARLRVALFSIACVLSGLVLGGLPLFVRNLVVFRSPLHNYNDRFLWIDPLDDFSEVFAPGALARLDRGPLAYFRALTPGKALLRIFRGLGETLVHLGDSMSLVSPRPFGPVHIFWLAAGLVAAFFSLRMIWRSARGFPRTFLLVHAAFNFGFFAFYNAVSGSSRYLMPLALTLLFPLANALGELGSAPAPTGSFLALGDKRGWPLRSFAACGVAMMLAIAFDPRQTVPPPGFTAAFDAIREHVAPGETFAVDSRSRLQPYWAMDPKVKMEIVSSSWEGQLLPADTLLASMRGLGARWIVLDGTSNSNDRPRWFFADLLPLDSAGSLPVSPANSLPAPLSKQLRVAWVDPGMPHHFALLEQIGRE